MAPFAFSSQLFVVWGNSFRVDVNKKGLFNKILVSTRGYVCNRGNLFMKNSNRRTSL